VTTADAGNPPPADAGSPSLSDTLNDTWKKFVQAVSPDNAVRQPDSENAGLKIPRSRYPRRPSTKSLLEKRADQTHPFHRVGPNYQFH